jgi:TonB family protein
MRRRRLPLARVLPLILSVVAPAVAGVHLTASPQAIVYRAEDVTLARQLTSPPPTYPYSAKLEHAQGDVELDVIVSAEGTVRAVRVTSSPRADLAAAAVDAVRKRTFAPATLNGKPVAMLLPTHVGFQLVGLAGGQPPAPPDRKSDARRAAAPPILDGEDGFTSGVLRLDQAGIVAPKPSKTPAGEMTPDAASHHVSGSVGMEVVVLTDGTVARARVTQSLDATYGLDEAALCAAMRWTFSPARLDGKPVAVLVPLNVTFTGKK